MKKESEVGREKSRERNVKEIIIKEEKRRKLGVWKGGGGERSGKRAGRERTEEDEEEEEDVGEKMGRHEGVRYYGSVWTGEKRKERKEGFRKLGREKLH